MIRSYIYNDKLLFHLSMNKCFKMLRKWDWVNRHYIRRNIRGLEKEGGGGTDRGRVNTCLNKFMISLEGILFWNLIDDHMKLQPNNVNQNFYFELQLFLCSFNKILLITFQGNNLVLLFLLYTNWELIAKNRIDWIYLG